MNDRDPEAGSLLASFLAFVWRHRALIGTLVGGLTVASVVLVLLVPVEYTAKVTLLPNSDSSSGLLSAARALTGGRLGSLGLRGGVTETAVQEAVVKSERMADLVNGDLDLQLRYRSKTREARLRKWGSLLKVKSNRQGLLTVSYRDRDPRFAVEVVNRVLVRLDEFNRESRSTAGRRARVFLEKRLIESSARLTALEDTLARVQAENRTVLLSTDPQKALSVGAELLANRLQLETEVGILRNTLGSRAPALEAKEIEIAALDRELSRLPRLNSELAGILRSRDAYAMAFTFLAAQLEEARLEEAKDTPTVEVLDPPVIPEEKSYPPRTWTVLGTFVAAWILALGAARIRDALGPARRSLERSGV
jgi:uncharacterized protein involved in exopolysaccharide biosynthesis